MAGRIDARDGLVLGVEHPHPALADGDGRGSHPQRDPVQKAAAAVVDAGQTACTRRLRCLLPAAEQQDDSDAHGERARRGERTPSAGGRSRYARAGGSRERAVVIEDPALEAAQALARLDAEFLGERHPAPLVGAQRLRLAVRAVQRQHQLGGEALAVGMLRPEHLQLADHLPVPSEGEVGLDPFLERPEPQLLETIDVGGRERLVGEVGQRRAPPQRERLPDAVGRGARVAARELPACLLHAAFEAVGVELTVRDAEQVSAAAGLQPAPALVRTVEGPAQARDMRLERLARGGRRRLPPTGRRSACPARPRGWRAGAGSPS